MKDFEQEADGPVSVPGPVVGEGPRSGRPARRVFTNEYKRAIVAEYTAAPHGSKAAVLRREGLYDSHVLEWRGLIEAGTLDDPTRRGRPKHRSPEATRIASLEKENAQLKTALAAKDAVIADREAALDVLGKGVAFLESLSSRNAK